jgi:hypothetical protein
LFFSFALEYAFRRVQENQDGLKLNGTHQLVLYADDVNILCGSIHSINKNTGALVVACKETGLEVNAIKLSTCLCLEIRMEYKVRIKGLMIVPWKGWKSSNVWEQPQ